MSSRIPTLDEIRALIPESMHYRTAIAGSFAIAPLTASDVDIWVLRDPFAGNNPTLEQDAAAILSHLTDVRLEEPPAEYNHIFDNDILLITGGIMPCGFRFHIMAAIWDSAYGLISTFDIANHAWAYPLNGEHTLISHEGSKRIDQPIELLCSVGSCPDPLATINRIIKFSIRYQTPPPFRLLRDLLNESQTRLEDGLSFGPLPEAQPPEDLLPLDDISGVPF